MKKNLLVLILMLNYLAFGQSQDSLPDFIKRYRLDNSRADLKVFIGEKIELKKDIAKNDFAFDEKYISKYKVLKTIYGEIKVDTIVFTAFDHYGKPAFSKFKHVILYLKKIDNKYIHCKYLYNPVFKTINDSWAGPYPTRDYRKRNKISSKIKPEIIEFKDEIVIDFGDYPLKEARIDFPSPYYQINESKAKVIYGNYANDLFLLKKEGILKTRGYF